MSQSPTHVNSTHFSSGHFPEVIGFCDRDNNSHVTNGDIESYYYKFDDKVRFTAKRRATRWEIIRYEDSKPLKVSTGTDLGMVLVHALTFSEIDRDKQEEWTNILIPVSNRDKDKALSIMYYLGGYPGSFLQITPEFLLIKEKFIGHDMDFLAYSYVPVTYIPWLREELRKTGIISEGNRNIWIYKK